jgi:hypothetical protein
MRIGNAAGFGGDNLDAPRLLAEQGELDFLTLEYLAELTLSVLAYQKTKNPAAGFVSDLPGVIESLVPALRQQSQLKIVTNGGGMNPESAARTVAKLLIENGMPDCRIAVCQGDDLVGRFDELIAAGESFVNLETGEPLGDRRVRLASANAYLGAAGIVDALKQDARIVITGRIADASLVVGPAVYYFGWPWDDFGRLGRATVAGHLIECGAQVTGGMFSDWDWQSDPDLASIGYPIAIIDDEGNCQITKPAGSQGFVTCQTVAEQLVYEIGDPQQYLTPDVTANFQNVQLAQSGPDRVHVTLGDGSAAPERYKVSLAYAAGFAVSGMIVFSGPRAVEHARAAAQMVRQRVEQAGFQLDRYHAEVIGAGDTFSGDRTMTRTCTEQHPWDVVLRIAAQDARREAVDRLARELAPLVSSGPPGVSGYTGSRPRSHPVLAFWPTTIDRNHCAHQVSVRSAKEWQHE